MEMMRKLGILAAVCIAVLVSGCGTTHASIETRRGEQLMLLGYDPVAYFTDGKPVRGKHTIAASHEGRTYYFATADHRAAFAQAPAKYEPQYGGFCSNGAPYAVKLGSDPTQFEVRDARLFIFYDTGGTMNNLVWKYPGWRAREGYSQPALGVPGEWDDKP